MPLNGGVYVRSLPPVAARIDRELADIEETLDWLDQLSPIDNDQMWADFEESSYRCEPTLRYAHPKSNLKPLRERLLELPVLEIEHPLLEAVLREKQRELDLQIGLVELRDSPGFVAASLDLFGGSDPSVTRTASAILEKLGPDEPEDELASCDHLVDRARDEIAWYRDHAPDFHARIILEDDLSSQLMVSRGNLHIARSATVPRKRVAPLVAHEVGTHVLTRYNGLHQPLRLLSIGLAHYDPMQEGLAALMEYVAGFLPPRRLRILAARVIASDLAVSGRGVVPIFDHLFGDLGLLAHDAFDVAVRARRGGGLTKDSVYLPGLREVLRYLADGGAIEFLFLGKFSLRQRSVLECLVAEGWVAPATLLPRDLHTEAGRRRLEHARRTPVRDLFQREPE